jgi:hypothetical protein
VSREHFVWKVANYVLEVWGQADLLFPLLYIHHHTYTLAHSYLLASAFFFQQPDLCHSVFNSMEDKLEPFSEPSFDKHDQHFRTVTSLIHLIYGNSSAAERTNENPQKDWLKYLATASLILARHREVVAAIPKYTRDGVTLYVSPQSDTVSPQSDTVSPQSDTVSPQSDTVSPQNDTVSPQSDTSFDVDEHSLLVARNPLNKKDCEKDELELDRVILCTNETLESDKIESSITGYIRDNWYVDRFFAIFR